MKHINFGYEFSKYSWVYPDYLYLDKFKRAYTEVLLKNGGISTTGYKKIPNKELKISANFATKDYVCSYWKWGALLTNTSGFGIIDDKITVPFPIENTNLIALLQTQGVEEGKLRGTYKLIETGTKGTYRLIPEGTAEDIFKTEVSKIYYDRTKPFTKKMKPGHLYITRTKQLILCVATDQDYYSKVLDGGSYMNYYFRIRSYSDTPRKVKLLANFGTAERFDTLDKCGITSIQDLIIDGRFRYEIYSDGFAGKDLGPYLQDDGRSYKESMMSGNGEVYADLCFIDNLFSDHSGIKGKIINYLSENKDIKNELNRQNSEASKLFGKLGL